MADRGFPRAIRLTRSDDHRTVNRAGRRLTTRHLVARFRRTDAQGPRFGLTVSRKVGNAVTRNRVKRWLREAVRNHRGTLTGVDVVLIARPNASGAGYHTLCDEVVDILGRIDRSAP